MTTLAGRRPSNARTESRIKGRLFVVSAPSGGGKTTVVKQLLRRFPRLVRSVSVTTRPPRRGERAGLDYEFITQVVFDRLKRTKALLEWAQVHGASYGTRKGPVMSALARGCDVVLSIDVQGARQVRRLMGSSAVLIFLIPPSVEALRERLIRRRTDTKTAIRRRLTVAKRELKSASWYDHQVVNDKLEDTSAKLAAIVVAGKDSVRRLRKGSVK